MVSLPLRKIPVNILEEVIFRPSLGFDGTVINIDNKSLMERFQNLALDELPTTTKSQPYR